MLYDDLNGYDQELLETEFDDEIEKAASEKVAAIQEVYEYGRGQAEKLASEIDEMYKLAEEEEEDEEDEEDEEEEEKTSADEAFEKEASELGAFIERGLHDELVKLGSERYGDPLYYYLPYIEEKIAAKGAMKALQKFRKGLSAKALKGTAQKVLKKGKAGLKKGKTKIKKFYSPTMGELRTGVTGKKRDIIGRNRKVSKKEQVKSLGRGLGRAATIAGPAAGLAGLGYMKAKKD